MDKLPLIVGIDAGGTTVRVAVADAESQRVRGEAEAPAGTDSAAAVEIALERLSKPLREANVVSVCAGVARLTRESVRIAWESVLQMRFGDAELEIVPDYVIAFQGATGGRGVAVIAGTGSVAYGEDGAGGSVRVGGRGWELGDEGSGGWLTTEMLRRAIRSLDGLAPSTALTQAVVDYLGTSDPAALGEAARRRAAEEGRGFLVPLALRWARDGDLEARNHFVGAAGWLGLLARVTAERLGLDNGRFPLAAVGGLWEAGDLLLDPFRTVVHRWLPSAEIVREEKAAVYGAVERAARSLQGGKR